MMKLLATALLAATVLSAPARAELLTFDDTGTSVAALLPTSYHGFTFNNWKTLSSSFPASGYVNGIVSPSRTACGCASDTGQSNESISRATSFTLGSGYFTSAWNDDATLVVKGLSGSTTLFSTTAVLDTSGPSLLTFDWSGIDSVQFSISGGTKHAGYGGNGNYFGLDNLTIGDSAVPEPASWALMLVGFGLVGLAARRRHGLLAA